MKRRRGGVVIRGNNPGVVMHVFEVPVGTASRWDCKNARVTYNAWWGCIWTRAGCRNDESAEMWPVSSSSKGRCLKLVPLATSQVQTGNPDVYRSVVGHGVWNTWWADNAWATGYLGWAGQRLYFHSIWDLIQASKSPAVAGFSSIALPRGYAGVSWGLVGGCIVFPQGRRLPVLLWYVNIFKIAPGLDVGH